MNDQTSSASVTDPQNPPPTLASTTTPTLESTSTQTPTESKPSTDPAKTPESLAAKPGEVGKPVEKIVPEKYEAFKAPEGFELNDAILEKINPLFKELELTQEGGQKVLDQLAPLVKDIAAKPYTDYFALRDTWRNDVLKDPVLGDGKALKPEVSASISKAIDSLGPELAKSFRETMNFTGAGDNPAFVRAFYELSLRATEGKPITGAKGPSAAGQSSPNGPAKSAAAVIFPNLPSAS